MQKKIAVFAVLLALAAMVSAWIPMQYLTQEQTNQLYTQCGEPGQLCYKGPQMDFVPYISTGHVDPIPHPVASAEVVFLDNKDTDTLFRATGFGTCEYIGGPVDGYTESGYVPYIPSHCGP